MFGLENEDNKGKRKKFDFDLEVEVKENASRKKEILASADKHIGEIKKQLREGAKGKDFEQLGTLLNGYEALKRVIKRI